MLFGGAIIIFSLINLTVNLNCNQRNVTNIEEHLKLILLCDYEPSRVPENYTTINALIEVNNLYQTTYSLHGTLNVILKYNESSLAFDPKNYDNISEITVEIEDIWTPKLYFYDNVDDETSIDLCLHKCMIQFSGMVICKFTCYLKLFCISNSYKWSSEDRNCSFIMFTINNYEDRVKFEFDISSTDENEYLAPWKLKAVEVSMPDIKSSLIYPVFGVSVAIEGHSYREFYSIMYPLYSILVMTFVAFALEFDSLMRIALIAVTIFLELQLPQAIDREYFKRPDQLPITVIYYRLTFSTSCFLICETLILRRLSKQLIRTPQWFTHLEFLYKFNVFNVYLDSDIDSSTHIISNLPSDILKWRLFCVILDRAFFIIWFIYNIGAMSF